MMTATVKMMIFVPREVSLENSVAVAMTRGFLQAEYDMNHQAQQGKSGPRTSLTRISKLSSTIAVEELPSVSALDAHEISS